MVNAVPSPIIKKLLEAIACIEDAMSTIENQPDSGDIVGVCIRDKAEVYKPQRIVRGLCPKCYSLLRARVDAGETTWEALEQAGQARVKGKTGRKKMGL